METIARIIKQMPNTVAVIRNDENECPLATIITGTYPVRYDKDGQAYLSKYNEAPAAELQIKALLLGFGEVFNYSEQALECFVTAILDEKMSLMRLKDALKHIYKTFDKNQFGKPKPGDIIAFDKPQTNEPVFLSRQMYNMAKGMVNLYYEENEYRISHSTELYNKSRDTFFILLKDQFGLPIREKNPTLPRELLQCYYVFSEDGWKNKDELLWCLQQEDYNKIQCKIKR